MSPTKDATINEVIALHGFNIKVSINEDSTATEAHRAIDTICAALNVSEGSSERLRHALGKVLAHVKDHDLYKDDFADFEAFKEYVGNKHRLSRATLQDSLMVATQLPKLTGEQAEKIPITNLTLVARAAKNASLAKVKSMLKKAETLTRPEMLKVVEPLIRHRDPQATDKVTLKIIVSKKIAVQWTKLVADQEPGDVLAELVALAVGLRRIKKAA